MFFHNSLSFKNSSFSLETSEPKAVGIFVICYDQNGVKYSRLMWPAFVYSTRIEELTNSREAISAKPLGIKLKFFTPLCTYRSSILHKVLERIREFHFFFTKKNFFSFFADFNHKNYTQEKFFLRYVSETHLHKIHFLLEIFRLFLGPRHPKLKKHKKWNISSGFQ